MKELASPFRNLAGPVRWGAAFFLTVGILSVGQAAYVWLSGVSGWQTLTSSAWNAMVSNFADHENRIVGLESGAESSATFLGTTANAPSIVSANGGYVQYGTTQNSNTGVFEVVNTGNYGIKFNKPGRIQWQYQQDFVTPGSTGYVAVQARLDGTIVANGLARTTGGQWNMVGVNGAYNVSAWQVLTFQISCSTCTISAMDNGVWWPLSILWLGK